MWSMSASGSSSDDHLPVECRCCLHFEWMVSSARLQRDPDAQCSQCSTSAAARTAWSSKSGELYCMTCWALDTAIKFDCIVAVADDADIEFCGRDGPLVFNPPLHFPQPRCFPWPVARCTKSWSPFASIIFIDGRYFRPSEGPSIQPPPPPVPRPPSVDGPMEVTNV